MKNITYHLYFSTFIFLLSVGALKAQMPVLVKDINSSGSSDPQYLTAIGNKIYFSANGSATSGNELWCSDGTVAGTIQIAEIFPGAQGADPKNLIKVNGKLFFSAKDPSHGEELWVYDPITNDTSFLKDIYSGTSGSGISNMFDFNGTLVFTAESINEGTELWKSDGTPSGTVLIKNIEAANGSAFYWNTKPSYAIINGYLYFVAIDSQLGGEEIFVTDGSLMGTYNYLNIHPFWGSYPSDLLAVGSTLYFRALTPNDGYELCKSNTNIGGYEIVKNIGVASANSNPNQSTSALVNISDTVFFVANDGANGFGDELWITTGYDSTTSRISDIYAGNNGSEIWSLFPFNGYVFFSATNGYLNNGSELYRSNGQNIPATAIPFSDLVSGVGSSNPNSFKVMNNMLYFIAKNNDELYVTNGSNLPFSYGQSYVSNLCPTTNTLFFQSYDNTNGYELWKLTPSTTGITEQTAELVNYPNPTTGVTTFTSNAPINEIVIYSLTGQQLLLQSVNQINSAQIDMSNFEAGVYIAVIATLNGKSSQRIVKQ